LGARSVCAFVFHSSSSTLATSEQMQHAPPLISTSESRFITNALASGLRVDGRRPLEARPLLVALGSVAGSVQVKLGATQVLAVATAELVEPYPDRPAEGVLQFFVEFSPMASPAFEAGRPPEAAVEMSRLLDRALRMSQAIDVESLCVVASKHVWSVRTDVTVIDDRGNLTDAATFAALVALRHLRLPPVSVSGVGDEASASVLSMDQGEPTPLVFHHTPVAVSLGFFRGGSGGGSGGGSVGGASAEMLSVVDPSDREELVLEGRLTVVLNQHQELCALHKPGGLPVAPARLLEAIRHAAALVPERLIALEEVLAQHAARLAAAAETLRRTGRKARRTLGAMALPPLTLVPLGVPPPPSAPPPSAPPPPSVPEATDGAEAVAEASVPLVPAAQNGAEAAEPAEAEAEAEVEKAAEPSRADRKKKRKKRATTAAATMGDDDDEEETVTVRSVFDPGTAS
jgi:exosome complex component RRP45